MQLPLDPASNTALFRLLRGLDAMEYAYVLVGGLVPPLLRSALEPDTLEDPMENRRTSDCDLAIDVAVSGFEKWARVQELLNEQGFTAFPKRSQFAWRHACGLLLDPMPVAKGIEENLPEALKFARGLVGRDTGPFFRGYELALQRPVTLDVEADDENRYPLKVAGLASLLAMKLQAWCDRPDERKKDAQDIGWLLLHLSPQVVVRELRDVEGDWPELVAEVIQRLERHFADADARGVSHYVRQTHQLSGPYAERHERALAEKVRSLLDLFSNT